MSAQDLAAVIAIAQEGGRLVTEMRRGELGVQTKSSAIDLVTEADVACQALIFDRLHTLAPEVGFWGEESDAGRPDTDYFWLVDPIDGTVNYAHNVPWYGVNIALNRGDETLLGVTLGLPSGTLFWAEKGKGAFSQEVGGVAQRMQVSTAKSLSTSLLSTGFPYHRGKHPDNNGAEFARIMPKCQGVRRMGSFVLDMAHVAAGHLEAHWEAGGHAWDAAPGLLMIQEAGGTVTTYAGAPWLPEDRTILASNGLIHEELLAEIQTARSTLTATMY